MRCYEDGTPLLEHDFKERLSRLSFSSYGDFRDVRVLAMLDETLDVAAVVKARTARRVYIARYAPGLSDEKLATMTTREIVAFQTELSELINRENGGDKPTAAPKREWI